MDAGAILMMLTMGLAFWLGFKSYPDPESKDKGHKLAFVLMFVVLPIIYVFFGSDDVSFYDVHTGSYTNY